MPGCSQKKAMPSSIFTKKFLLDENVRQDLYHFLRSQHIDTRFVSKSASDRTIQEVSLREKRILVTNDNDFTLCAKEEIFFVVWLRIPQHSALACIKAFQKLLEDRMDFAWKIIVLKPHTWEAFYLSGK